MTDAPTQPQVAEDLRSQVADCDLLMEMILKKKTTGMTEQQAGLIYIALKNHRDYLRSLKPAVIIPPLQDPGSRQ